MSYISAKEAAQKWGISERLEGIRCWDKDRSVFMDVCMEAQMRFEAQIALQGLLECHAQYQQIAKRNNK